MPRARTRDLDLSVTCRNLILFWLRITAPTPMTATDFKRMLHDVPPEVVDGAVSILYEQVQIRLVGRQRPVELPNAPEEDAWGLAT